MSANPSRNYKNDRAEEFARWRRRDHANQEAMQNLIYDAVAEAAGVEFSPKLRAFISALQSAHGGGEVINEPFQRKHTTVAAYLGFRGTEEAQAKRVRDRINELEEFHRLARVRFYAITRGGAPTGRKTAQGGDIYTCTEYVDLLKPIADEAVQRARESVLWRGDKAQGISPHPGKALAAQVAWAVERLPVVDEQEQQQEKKAPSRLPLHEYLDLREPRLLESIEAVADEVELREGDSDAWLEKMETLISRMRQSRRKTRNARTDYASLSFVEDAERENVVDATNAYTSDKIGISQILEEIRRPPADPTKMSVLPEVSINQINNLEFEEVAPVENAEEMTMLDWALFWAGAGLPVFPCHAPTDEGCSCRKADCRSIGKHPRTSDGVMSATVDEKLIRAWWARWPSANIGGATGTRSRVHVVDVDPKNDGDASLHDLVEAHGGEWLETAKVKTGSGGFHFFFVQPDALDLRNTAGKIAPGIDSRGTGGYVILPPSLHQSGERYELVDFREAAPLPEWLTERLTATAAQPVSKVIDFQAQRTRSASGVTWGDGERNNGLFGWGIGRWRYGLAADVTELHAQLSEANSLRCSPPLDGGEVAHMAAHIARDYAHLRGIDGDGKTA